MTFFYLQQPTRITVSTLRHGRYYTKDQVDSGVYPVPFRSVPYWYEYTGNYDDVHNWKNPMSSQIYEKHPLGLTVADNSFFDGFYEIIETEGLTFGEGEAWCLKTNQPVRVEKTEPMSVWNPFFQKYDQPCDRNERDCELHRIKYDFSKNSFHEFFSDDIEEFFTYYCRCCRCQNCLEIHLWDCIRVPSQTKNFLNNPNSFP
jgi:hypothetical protein